MKNKSKFFLIICLSTSINTNVFAETKLSLCNGVWTTKSCDKPEKSIDAITREDKKEEIKSEVEEKTTVASKEEELKPVDIAKEVSSILHPLNMKVIEIREKYQKEVDASPVTRYCQSEKVDLKKCQEMVDSAMKRAEDYELKLDELALEEKQLSNTAEEKIQPIEQNVVNINQVTTSIKQDTNVQINKLP